MWSTTPSRSSRLPMSSLLQLSLLLLLLLCLLAQPASSQPSVYGAPQVQPNSLSGGSYVVELIAAASNSSSGAAFYLVDVNFAVKAVSPSGVLLATSSFCSGYSAAFTVNFCSSLEPRPHGAVVWVRGKSVREADAFTTGFTAALDATTLALVVSIPDTLLSPAPTYSVVNELSGGSVCTDSSGSAYLIGVGEVWRLSVSGVQLGYFTVPSAVVPNGVLAYSPQLVGAFDRQDLLWLFSVAPWNGTASFGVWRTTPSNGSLVSSGNLTLPGVRWSRNLFLAAGSVSIDSAGYAYVGVRDNDYVDAQSVYRAVYVFDGQYNSAAVIDPPQGQDQLNEAALGFGSSSIAWGSAAGQDRLYASALGNFSVAVLSTSSLAVLGSITPQASPLLATQFLSYDASTDSFVAMQPCPGSCEQRLDGSLVFAYRVSRSGARLGSFSYSFGSFQVTPLDLDVDGQGNAVFLFQQQTTVNRRPASFYPLLFFTNYTLVWSVNTTSLYVAMDAVNGAIYLPESGSTSRVDVLSYNGSLSRVLAINASAAAMLQPSSINYNIFYSYVPPGPVGGAAGSLMVSAVSEYQVYAVDVMSGAVSVMFSWPALISDAQSGTGADILVACRLTVDQTLVVCSGLHTGVYNGPDGLVYEKYQVAFASVVASGDIFLEYGSFENGAWYGTFAVDPQGSLWAARNEGLVSWPSIYTVRQPLQAPASSSSISSPTFASSSSGPSFSASSSAPSTFNSASFASSSTNPSTLTSAVQQPPSSSTASMGAHLSGSSSTTGAVSAFTASVTSASFTSTRAGSSTGMASSIPAITSPALTSTVFLSSTAAVTNPGPTSMPQTGPGTGEQVVSLDGDSGSSTSTGAIVGGVVGGVAGLAICCCALAACLASRRRGKQAGTDSSSKVAARKAEEGHVYARSAGGSEMASMSPRTPHSVLSPSNSTNHLHVDVESTTARAPLT